MTNWNAAIAGEPIVMLEPLRSSAGMTMSARIDKARCLGEHQLSLEFSDGLIREVEIHRGLGGSLQRFGRRRFVFAGFGRPNDGHSCMAWWSGPRSRCSLWR